MSPSLEDIRALITPIVASKLHDFSADDRAEVCQEAWIACWQKLSCKPVEDWRAYCATIASHKAADAIAQRKRARRIFEQLDAEHLDIKSGEWHLPGDDVIGRVAYVILRFFMDHKAACAEIAMLRYFKSMPWDAVGRQVRSTTDGIKQKWHRCVGFLLQRVGPELTDILESRIDDFESMR